ncbi:hypothetical protein Q4Q49_19640 [Shewanella sp. SP1S1-7]|jgi:hypothetical protein|uniref:hypothetical protein n=1 Tax=Shewanella TaxID=22 RepID=UPI001C733D2C|nr:MULTISPECIES: hypothetical protein [unclassified Shewanella]MDT3321342.1 hypothetical protein [Shewanella sp. SP1S2-4]MDT3337490.1 hypothetical protein [Shewanella sp. SP1S1-7]QYX63450.1 hypothetical protein K2227_14820 [Shewanella putrefaciens]
MKKTSLALIAALSMFTSVAANADATAVVDGTAAGFDVSTLSVGTLVATSIGVGVVIATVVVIGNDADGNPITGTVNTVTYTN